MFQITDFRDSDKVTAELERYETILKQTGYKEFWSVWDDLKHIQLFKKDVKGSWVGLAARLETEESVTLVTGLTLEDAELFVKRNADIDAQDGLAALAELN